MQKQDTASSLVRELCSPLFLLELLVILATHLQESQCPCSLLLRGKQRAGGENPL